jgi:tetratricopeptide (TPR) repeat protein
MFVYPRWTIDLGQIWQWLFPIAAAAVPVALWFARKRIGRGPLAAVLFFVGSLFPALGFVNVFPMRYSFVADHFQYLASIGIITLLAAATSRAGGVVAARFVHSAARGTSAMGRRGAGRGPTSLYVSPAIVGSAAAGAAVLLIFGSLTFAQCFAYADAETLWQDSIASNPESWMSQNNLAALLSQQKRYPEAIDHYRAALKIRKESTMLVGLGFCLGQTGNFDEAITVLQDACRFEPTNVEAFCRLAEVYSMTGQTDQAAKTYKSATAIKPTTPIDFTNLGMAYSRLGDTAKAADCDRAAIALDADALDAWINLGVAQVRLGDDADALAAFSRAHEIAPDDPRPFNGRGVIFLRQSRPAEAAEEFSGAIGADPGFPDAYANLAQADAMLGRRADAERNFQHALELDPDNAQARDGLARLYGQRGE